MGKPKPRFEGEIRKAHDIRLLCSCAICDGVGLSPEMIAVAAASQVHPSCFYQVHGERALLQLSQDDLAKVKVSDAPVSTMKKLVRKLR